MRKNLLLLVIVCTVIACSSKTSVSYDQCRQTEGLIQTSTHGSTFDVSNSAFLDLLNSDSSSISYSFPLLKDSMCIIESEDGLIRIYDDFYGNGRDEDEIKGFTKCTVQYKDENGEVHAVWGDIRIIAGAEKEGDSCPANGYSSGGIDRLLTFQVEEAPVYVVELIETYPYHYLSIKLIAFHIKNGKIEGYPLFKHRKPDDANQDLEYPSNPVYTVFTIETDGFPDGQGMKTYAYDNEKQILFWVPYEDTYDYYSAYHFDGKNLYAIECDVKKLLEKNLRNMDSP